MKASDIDKLADVLTEIGVPFTREARQNPKTGNRWQSILVTSKDRGLSGYSGFFADFSFDVDSGKFNVKQSGVWE